jgi:hypothetical protein
MKMFLTFAAAAAALAATPAASAASEREYGQRAAINSANFDGISDWHADDDNHLYVRDRTGRWYLATLSGPCPWLAGEPSIGFETGPMGRFDEWSAIRVGSIRCHVRSLVTSPAPAAKGGPKS